MTSLSYSECAAWARCPREWWLAYSAGVTVAQTAAMARGSAVHACLERALRGDAMPELGTVVDGVPIDACALDVSTRYLLAWPGEQWQTEAEWERDGFHGRVDAIRNGVVLEHKCVSRLPDDVGHMWQCHLYQWGAGAERVIYDAIVIPALRGRRGETAEELGRRIASETTFARIDATASEEAIAETLADLTAIGLEIERSRGGVPPRRNRTACWRCRYPSVCWELSQ